MLFLLRPVKFWGSVCVHVYICVRLSCSGWTVFALYFSVSISSISPTEHSDPCECV